MFDNIPNAQSIALPFAVTLTFIVMISVLYTPKIIQKKNRSWASAAERLSKLRAYKIHKNRLCDKQYVSAGDIVAHKHLSACVLIVSHLYPAANQGLKQIQRDALQQFLVYLLVFCIIFVALASQASNTSAQLALSASFIGSDVLTLIRLFDKYRTFAEMIEAHSETLEIVR